MLNRKGELMQYRLNLKEIEELMEQYNSIFYKRENDTFVLFKYRYYAPEIYLENPKLRELRGIIFNKHTGEVVQRPFHKFFNHNEPNCTIDYTMPAIETEKYDGSMIASTLYDDELFVSTTGNLKSSIAEMGKDFIVNHNNYLNIIKDFENYTVLFEYITPKNRIVIDYKKENMILLAIRNKKTGEYISTYEIMELGKYYKIPSIEVKDELPLSKIVEKVKGMKGVEGAVAYADNDMVKIKTMWYLERHRLFTNELDKREIAEAFFSNKIDDYYSLVDGEKKEELDKIVDEIINLLTKYTNIINSIEYSKYSTKKELVEYCIKNIPKPIHWIIFKKYSEPSVDITDYLAKTIINEFRKNKNNKNNKNNKKTVKQ